MTTAKSPSNQTAEELGFASEQERDAHIQRCFVATPEQIVIYQRWQFYDGTKEGLLKMSIYHPR